MGKQNYIVFILLVLVAKIFSQEQQLQAAYSNFDSAKVKSIGVYVHPTREKSRDRMTYNITSLHFLTLGYKVINLNQKLQMAKRLKRNYKKNINFILSANDTSSQKIDLVISIRPEWKKRYISIPIKRQWGVRKRTVMTEWALPVMKMKLDIIDVVRQATILSGESADTLRLKEINEGENGALDVSAIPIRYLIQRNLANFIADFPPCYQPETLDAEYRFPIIFCADQFYRSYYRNEWKSILERRLIFVNDIFKRQFGIEFYIHKFRSWNTTRQDSLRLLIEQLIDDTNSIKDAIIIGVTHDQFLAFNWFKRNLIGIAYELYNYTVVKDLPTTTKLRIWDPLEETVMLIHELGHIFGAIHILDPTSVMYPMVGTMSYEFDEFNQAIINYTKERLDQLRSAEQLAAYVEEVVNIHQSFNIKNVHFAGKVGIIASQYISMGNSIDSLSMIFSDSSLYHAARGYLYFKEEEWEKAKQSFEKSVELDPDFSSAYYDLGFIYKKLGDKDKASKYWKKAKKKGFKDTKIESW